MYCWDPRDAAIKKKRKTGCAEIEANEQKQKKNNKLRTNVL